MKQINHCRAFCEVVGNIKLFKYQIDFLKSCLDSHRVIGVFSRQTGKTTMISLFAIYMALQEDNYKVLIIAPTDRQAGELFGRLSNSARSSGLTAQFIKSSTMREIVFINESYIRAMTTGDFGDTIRGQTADMIILEESSYIKSDIVGKVIIPMIASRGSDGRIIQIGTPFFKNHFYESFMSDKYSSHNYDYTNCPLITEEFIQEQKKNLTKMEFAMEYEAKFIEDSDCYFSSELIHQSIGNYVMIKREEIYG